MAGRHETPLKAGLAAALVLLGFLLAVQVPTTTLAGGGFNQLGPTPGRLLVSVVMNNGGFFQRPLAGVQVGVTQNAAGGLHLLLTTNSSGEVGLPLPPGGYAVSASNSKFLLLSGATVNSGKLTTLQVTVNRTAYYATFVEADDSTTQGSLEPWNTVTVQVAEYGYPIFPPPGTQQTIISVGSVPFRPGNFTFGQNLFLQALRIDYLGEGSVQFVNGTEVPATLVSQTAENGTTWLSLHPAKLFQVAGAEYVLVVDYAAGSRVTMADG